MEFRMHGDVLNTDPVPRQKTRSDVACPDPGEPQEVGGHEIRGRIAIEDISPDIDGGNFPAKRVVGDHFRVEADIFSDGHDKIAAALVYRRDGTRAWSSTPMHHVENDRWRGTFLLLENGSYTYTIVAWRDLFGTWREDVKKKRSAGQPVTLELQEGRHLLEQARHHSSGGVGTEDLLRSLDGLTSNDERLNVLLQDEVAQLMDAVGPRANETRADRDLKVWVDRPVAAFSAWYELFPRSQSGDVRRHGTFGDVITRLDYVSDLGFDVLYFPPIHPIGEVNRKGRNNSLTAEPDDPGSPYAIGSKLGGHDAIHAELGTAEDFRLLVAAARERGLEIALDFAIQCAPDHPWIKEHPEWFDWRPDGTIKFAENPPKKYEDIVNVHFYRDAFPALWHALRDVVLHWVGEGVRIFRVDNLTPNLIRSGNG
jgi:starch synthase (maltosyl-transferring)